MEGNNYELVNKGFRLLLTSFAPYVCAALKADFREQWWNRGVMEILYDTQKEGLPLRGDDEELMRSLDILKCLNLFEIHWGTVFRKRLGHDPRNWARELVGFRHRTSHLGSDDFSDDDTWRALDTMARLCGRIDPQKADEIRSLMREARYGSAAGSMAENSNVNPDKADPIPNISGLPCWRDVIEPHPDVAQGRYQNAEFAADLAQVSRGEGAFEYVDPVEFFARTYVTGGMKGLLVQALERVTRQGGEPVIQLKTAFGGGKTHSMLALYHLLRGKAPLEKIPAIKNVMEDAGIRDLPAVHVAALVGTALDPSRGRRPPNLPGVTVNTLWGELAAQLAISAGKPELYNYVREADKKGISPGSEALQKLFDAAGSCVALVDELVAYARKLYGVNGLPAGTFDNFLTFVQELGEAAKASKSSLVVASIPESDIEIGGEPGKKALQAIEHTFGRMEAIWKPVEASEGFEVVRRRLFLNCKNPAARDLACGKFSEMYNDNPSEFPLESREMTYRQRLVACYPIHPEVFDRLYEDWATLERFQRTRGVLRFMAAVIHELWMNGDQSLLIEPGSLPLDVPAVRNELTRYLSDSWNGIVEREVDGDRSVPFMLDRENPRYGKLAACRRLARTIMLGSAPAVRQQKVRGLETSRIRLGVAQPGENISVFNDALGTLQNSLSNLYSVLPESNRPASGRYWFDTRPTLRKTVEDRLGQIADSEVELEIEKRLKARCKKIPPFAGVITCPASSHDVPDNDEVQMVVLGPGHFFAPNNEHCKALAACRDILDNRGNSPRSRRNMLVFLAPDKTVLEILQMEVRRYLAWQSIKRDRLELNLDAAQDQETENSIEMHGKSADMRVNEAWCWLLAPIATGASQASVRFQPTRLAGEGLIARAAKKLLQDEEIITSWAPALLLMELDKLLWRDKDYIEIRTLWKVLGDYCYLPRLADYAVLEDAIRKGVENSDEYFAYAAGIADGRFIDLQYDRSARIEFSGLLVKRAAAKRQLDEEAPGIDGGGKKGGVHEDPKRFDPREPGDNPPPPPPPPRPKRFYLNKKLDLTRINKDVADIVSEILNHLSEDGKLEITLEVQGNSEKGFGPQTVRVARENCNTLKVDQYGFDS